MDAKDLAARPAVSELTFQLFDRSIHPELIETLVHQEFKRDGCRLSLDLTPAGHLLRWQKDRLFLSEVLADQKQLLPETRQLFAHRVAGERTERHEPASTIRYQSCFQVEKLAPELFYHLHDELRRDGDKSGVLHVFHPLDRLGLSPLTFVDIQSRRGSLLVHVYHTFPDDYAVVKTQTLIEFPG